jgi:hypothetical protein
MADITLKAVRNIETLAHGYNYEGTVDLAEDIATGGASDLKVGGAQLAGTISKAAIVVDELVPETSSSGTTYTSVTVSLGDDDDSGDDNLVDDVQVEETNGSVASVGTAFVNTGASIALPLLTDKINLLVTSAGEADEALMTGGKLRIFLEYHPTAGEPFNG